MNASIRFRKAFGALTSHSVAVLLLCAVALPVRAAETSATPSALAETAFQQKLRSLERARDGETRAREAGMLLRDCWFSSLQVKAIAKTIGPEDARYEFAVAAYPRTVDPENYYEVYDVFTSYSKVFRLHDQIQRLHPPRTPLPTQGPPIVLQPVSDEAFADMLKSLRAEGLEDTREALARQMLAGRPRFLSRHIRELVKTFAFDDTRLEIAKYAYDSVVDPENYYLVNQAFTFSDSKEALARYIESRGAERRPPSRPPARPNR